MHWFRDSVDVINMDDDDRCVSGRQDETFTLQIYNTMKRDSGYYMCVAVSSQGQSAHRFLLAVTGDYQFDPKQLFSIIFDYLFDYPELPIEDFV